MIDSPLELIEQLNGDGAIGKQPRAKSTCRATCVQDNIQSAQPITVCPQEILSGMHDFRPLSSFCLGLAFPAPRVMRAVLPILSAGARLAQQPILYNR